MEIGLIVLNVLPPAGVVLSVPAAALGYDLLAAVLVGMAAVLLLVRMTPAARPGARALARDAGPVVVTVVRGVDRDEPPYVAGKAAGMR